MSRKTTDISKTSETIVMMDYSSGSNQLGAGNRHVRKPSHLKSPDGNDTEFWTHKWGVTNYLMIDGSAKSLSFVQSFLGLRYPWDQPNPKKTMWDSYRQ